MARDMKQLAVDAAKVETNLILEGERVNIATAILREMIHKGWPGSVEAMVGQAFEFADSVLSKTTLAELRHDARKIAMEQQELYEQHMAGLQAQQMAPDIVIPRLRGRA